MIIVSIITPQGITHTGEYDEVTIPTTTGQIGVRTGHKSLVTTTIEGTVTLKKSSKNTSFQVREGVAEINPDKVSVIVRGLLK